MVAVAVVVADVVVVVAERNDRRRRQQLLQLPLNAVAAGAHTSAARTTLVLQTLPSRMALMLLPLLLRLPSTLC